MTPEDLRAGVSAGLLTEVQAASLLALAARRAGLRATLPAEDEPFEFFRGFSEIFIAIGLMILLGGLLLVQVWYDSRAVTLTLSLAIAAIAWGCAGYFTLKRRMNLPSMVLAASFGLGVVMAGFAIALGVSDPPPRTLLVLLLVVATLAMGLWYRRFRLPFSMFVLGGFALAALYAATGALDGFLSGRAGLGSLFDLRASPVSAMVTLAFGFAAFLAGLWFDTRDPHRLGRHAATAFWLHLLAAPALVNPLALTLANTGGSGGMALLALVLAVVAFLALVIDRRSFLTAAIAYIGLVIGWGLGDADDAGTWAFTLLALGALITALGTWWVPLRGALMRRLPTFPGKTRLPPYARPE